jgi:hypothetical protein
LFVIFRELGHDPVVFFLRKQSVGKLTKDGILLIDVVPEDENQSSRAVHEIGHSFTFQRIQNPGNKRWLLAVLEYHLVDWAALRCGPHQYGEQDPLLDGLMVLVPKNLKEFKDGLHIGDFDTFSVFQFFHHPLEDVQPSPKDDMISNNKFSALHRSFQ